MIVKDSMDMRDRKGLGSSRQMVDMVLSAEQAGKEIIEKIRVLEKQIKEVLEMMAEHRSYDDTFLKLQRRYVSLVEEKEDLYREFNRVREIAYGRDMAILGFGFAIASMMISLISIYGSSWVSSPAVKAALFGFSIGMGVGGILTSVGGLRSTDRAMAFLSGVGIASSLVGIGVDIYGLKEN